MTRFGVHIGRASRAALMALTLASTGACAGTGGLGSVLGSVLGSQSQNQGQGQIQGTVLGLDTRNQQLALQQYNGGQITLYFDNQTQVVYGNRGYPITALQRGDQVTANVQATNNNAYYVSAIQVTQSASNNGSVNGGQTQSFQGTVQQIDGRNGRFVLAGTNGGSVTVTLPQNPSQNDYNRFQNLRTGDYVRFNGVYYSNGLVQLQGFY